MATPPKQFELATDGMRTARDLGIVVVSVILTWAVEQFVPYVEEKQWMPAILVPLIAALLSAVRRWWVDTRQ